MQVVFVKTPPWPMVFKKLLWTQQFASQREHSKPQNAPSQEPWLLGHHVVDRSNNTASMTFLDIKKVNHDNTSAMDIASVLHTEA
jgi:hypothetical protein